MLSPLNPQVLPGKSVVNQQPAGPGLPQAPPETAPVFSGQRAADYAVGASLKASASLRFGSDSTAEAKRILDDLLPRLAAEAKDWDNETLYPEGYSLASGTDLRFRVGDTRYTLREIFNEMPGIAEGEYLLIDGPAGKKSLFMGKRDYMQDTTEFGRYWRAFHAVGNPQIAERRMENILQNLDGFQLGNYVQLAPEHGGRMSFTLHDRPYYLPWHPEKAEWMYEGQDIPEERIQEQWRKHVTDYEEENAKRPENQRLKISSYEQYREQYKSHHKNGCSITPEQQTTLLDALRDKLNTRLAEAWGFGENMDPAPFLHKVARALLADPLNGAVDYRYHDERVHEVVFDTTRSAEPGKGIYVELSKAPMRDDGDEFNYYINTRTGKPPLMVVLTKPEDIALIEKMLDIVMSLDTSNGGNWHISLMQAMERLQKGTSSVEEEVDGIMPQIDRSLPDVSEKPADKLKAAAAMLDELEAMLPPEA